MKTKEHKVYASPADWAEAESRPWREKYYQTELEATAALEAGNRDEERLLRSKARVIRKHIERYEALA